MPEVGIRISRWITPAFDVPPFPSPSDTLAVGFGVLWHAWYGVTRGYNPRYICTNRPKWYMHP